MKVAHIILLNGLVIISLTLRFEYFSLYTTDTVFFIFYFLTAMVGLLMYYRWRKEKFHLFSQLPVLSSIVTDMLGLSLEKSATLRWFYFLLLFCSYAYLVVCGFNVLFRSVEKQKKQRQIFYAVVLFLLIVLMLYYIGSFSSINPYSSIRVDYILIWVAASLISVFSFDFTLRGGREKEHLVYFQSAFFSSFIFSTLLFWRINSPAASKIMGHDVAALLLFLFVILHGVTFVSAIWFLFNRYFLRYWKRKPFGMPPHDRIPVPVGGYIDVHGKAGWMDHFVRTSDRGVIGLTGVRGAGKSSLLENLRGRLCPEFFTHHITSPVHPGERMEFFMMVCREVCAKVINEIENRVFYFTDSSAWKAKAGVLLKIRAIFLVVIAFIAGSLVLLSFKNIPKKESPSVYGEIDFHYFVVQSEINHIKNLRDGLNAYLGKKKTSFKYLVIIPKPGSYYWDILPAIQKQIEFKDLLDVFLERTVLPHRFSFLRKNIISFPEFRRKIKFGEYKSWNIDGPRFFKALKNKLIHNGIVNEDIFNLVNDSVFISRAYDLFVAAIRLKLGESAYLYWVERERIKAKLVRDIRETAEHIFQGKNQLSVTHLTRSVGKLLEVEESVKGPPKLMTRVLLRAFITYIASSQKEALLLDMGEKGRARQLRDYLTVYLDNLSSMSRRQSVQTVPVKYSKELWILGIIAFLLIAGPFLSRWFNYFMASLFNLRDFGMLLKSKEFIRLLTYSETSEKKGSFSFSKAFGFSMSKRQAQRELTLSGLTNMYIQYIKEVSRLYNDKMIICIDELDKVDDHKDVKTILREIKGALFVENTFYFISISRDAAISFQNRLSTGRDIFESTFDRIITLDRMTVPQAWEVIRNELVKKKQLPAEDGAGTDSDIAIMEANAAVLTMFSGGVPREMIQRSLKEVLDKYDRFDAPKPADICILLLKQRLRQLIRNVSLVAVSGEDSLTLHNVLTEIESSLTDTDKFSDETIEKAASLIEKCLSIIDPESLYMKPLHTFDELQAKKYKAIREDVKKYVDMLIMLAVFGYFYDFEPDNPINEEFQERIASSTAVLDENPALAKHILSAHKK
jgi:hypothetical protein